MAGRPHFQSSIADLESRFEQIQNDWNALHALDLELSFRSTERAGKLRRRVAALLVGRLNASPGGNPAGSPPDLIGKAAPRETEPPRSAAQREGRSQSLADAADIAAPSSPSRLPPSRRSPLRPVEPDSPAGVLGAWVALEALSPQTYRRAEDLGAGDRTCIADLAKGLPWTKGERSRPKRQLYYRIILGAVAMDRATASLVKAFGADEEKNPRQREKAALAELLVDRHGVLVETNGIAISSFAWALPKALQLELDELDQWPQVEQEVIEDLERQLRRLGEDGKPLAMTSVAIQGAFAWIVRRFGLGDDLVEPPRFAVRHYHYFKSPNPPEASLLNSFYLGDLSRAAALNASGEVPAGLRRFLGMERPRGVVDLLADNEALEAAVAPDRIPPVRWPSPGGHPLVLLQQAAVDLARGDLTRGDLTRDDRGEGCGILAVNGPPGTGKTTLLRDIVAGSVFDRALAMAEFDDPADAFAASGVKHAAGGRAFFQVYRLDASLKGHEVLVASSNNKAVENVSRELPAAAAVGRSRDELSYFRSVSDLLHADPSPAERGGDEAHGDTMPDPVETWGLIAAVLGNARNRAAFQQRFWWHDDLGFRLYLKAAKGDPVVREIRDPDTDEVVERKTPRIVLEEKPPSAAQARANWRTACRRLRELHASTQDDLAALGAVRDGCIALKAARAAVPQIQVELDAAVQAFERSRTGHGEALGARNAAASAAAQSEAALLRHMAGAPGFFSRLFRTRRWKRWEADRAPLARSSGKATTTLHKSEEALVRCSRMLSDDERILAGWRQELLAATALVAQLVAEVNTHRARLGGRLIDDAFFAQGHEVSNLAAPWVPDSVHRKREALFVAALAVHKAFIDCAAQKILHNLSVLMDVFSAGAPKDPAKRALLSELWSTLFLVVPVLSTTFASVERMLGDLPPDALGWLLIDEAGQALPQAAVGAIMRARRAIVVGDPLQIPPVVALPERLSAEICRFFAIDRDTWAAPSASAQTLADKASSYQASYRSDQGPRKVGIPLLVHRRCEEPMFGISNRIAYARQMVHATSAAPSEIGRILGASRWFDVDGEADTKYCRAEGDMAAALLGKLANEGLAAPDLFLITPFRIVAQELRRRLEQETGMMRALGVDPRTWVNDRVGTIHTVQGREAEAVILVLGAPRADQAGARSWAAGTPNILNVAVSRAKRRLYVVGSRGVWQGVGHASELSSLPSERR